MYKTGVFEMCNGYIVAGGEWFLSGQRECVNGIFPTEAPDKNRFPQEDFFLAESIPS